MLHNAVIDFEKTLKKNEHRKWHCFTVWLYGGTSKSSKTEKIRRQVPLFFRGMLNK